MATHVNLARVTTATTGTGGTITLGAAVSGYLTFGGAGVPNGGTVFYGIKDGANSEVGYGIYTASGTTLTRNVITSTNSNNAITLSGAAEVYVTALAQEFPNYSAKGQIAVSTAANTVGVLGVAASDGLAIVSDSGEATGVKWASVSPDPMNLTLGAYPTAPGAGTITVFGGTAGTYPKLSVITSDQDVYDLGSEYGSDGLITSATGGTINYNIPRRGAMRRFFLNQSSDDSVIVAKLPEPFPSIPTEDANASKALILTNTGESDKPAVIIQKYGSTDTLCTLAYNQSVMVAPDGDDTGSYEWVVVGVAPGTTGSVATDAIWDAKGDLAVGTGANMASKLTVGTNGYVLTADSGEATGLKWAAAASAGAPTDATYVTTTANGTLSAEKVLPFLANYNPDIPPASPSAFDDEFDDDSIAAAWTGYGTPDTVSESTYHGFLYFADNDNENIGYRKTFQPGATEFTVVAKVRAMLDYNFPFCGVIVVDSSNNAIATATVQVKNGVVYARTLNGASESTVALITAAYGGTTVRDYYVLMTRDSSQAYKTYYSLDGMLWHLHSSFNNNATVDKIQIVCNAVSAQTYFAFDFLRTFASQTTVIGRAP